MRKQRIVVSTLVIAVWMYGSLADAATQSFTKTYKVGNGVLLSPTACTSPDSIGGACFQFNMGKTKADIRILDQMKVPVGGYYEIYRGNPPFLVSAGTMCSQSSITLPTNANRLFVYVGGQWAANCGGTGLDGNATMGTIYATIS